jgi:hypothetical protein
VVDGLDARLGLSGHGRPFVDVGGHIAGSRGLVEERLGALLEALDGRVRTPLELAPAVHGEALTEQNASRLLQETLCYLQHLEHTGRVARESDEDPPRWRRV